MPSAKMLAGFELVDGAAVRALRFAGPGDVQEDARVGVPELHARGRAGAEHAAVGVEVPRQQFDDHRLLCNSTHVQTLVSQWAYFGLRPLTMSKKALWIFSVRGPREPAPISTRSSSRMGVTSAAVPVKKASSAM